MDTILLIPKNEFFHSALLILGGSFVSCSPSLYEVKLIKKNHKFTGCLTNESESPMISMYAISATKTFLQNNQGKKTNPKKVSQQSLKPTMMKDDGQVRNLQI